MKRAPVDNAWARFLSSKLNARRIAYSASIQSMAALVEELQGTSKDKLTILEVLVSNLDDACKEARKHNLSRLPNLVKLKGVKR